MQYAQYRITKTNSHMTFALKGLPSTLWPPPQERLAARYVSLSSD